MPFKLLFVLGILFIACFIACRWLYKAREHRGKLVKRGVLLLSVVVLASALCWGYYRMAGISGLPENAKANLIHLNESRRADGTTVRLNEVFMDLFTLAADYSVWGRDKVVAIELKKGPEDISTIAAMAGLWCGGGIIPEKQSFSMSYKAEEFVDPVFIVFYLSNGESISFEVKDRTNVKGKVKVINIGKTISDEGRNITVTRFCKGIGYSALLFEADFMPSTIDFEIADGDSVVDKKASWSGGGSKYTGSVYFDPVKSDRLKITVKKDSEHKADTIELEVD